MRFSCLILLSFCLAISWGSYAQVPVITGQDTPNPIIINEDGSIALSLDNLTVDDIDNAYPADFTLAVLGGTNYTVAGNTVTPDPDFNGALTVSVTVNDGTQDSAPFDVQIQVDAVNDPPSFTKGLDQAILEDGGAQSIASWATLMSAGPSDENTQILAFTLSNDNNALFSVQPSINSSTGTLTYTPAADANGVANVSVTLMDDGGTGNGGDDTFTVQTFVISVTSVNDAPSFVKGADVSVSEDAGAQSIASWTTVMSAGPSDENTQILTFTLGNDNNALFSVQPSINSSTGTLTYTPAADANGVANVSVTLMDDGGTGNGGNDTFTVQTFVISVASVNDAPSFVKGADVAVSENAAAQTISGWATSISTGQADESSQVLTFILSNDNSSLFSVQPAINSTTGTLTFTPAANISGVANVSVTLSDDGGVTNGGVNTSATQTFTISISTVNNEPSFVKGSNQTILEDAGVQAVTNWATFISAGPPDESAQILTFTLSNDNNALFSVQPSINSSTGTLSYTPAPNAHGVANVSVTLNDDGGTANGGDDTSITETFSITISEVNDGPSFVKGADEAILEDAGAQTVNGWASTISNGPANESSQVLTFLVNNDNTSLFSIQPSINSTTGTLTYTPAANANGVANVSVTLSDDGGTANGGINSFAVQTFVLTIISINDQPSFIKGADQSILEDAGAQSVANWATSISSGPSNENIQALTFSVTNDNNTLFSVQPSINSSTGTLTYTATANTSGVANVTVILTDNGGTLNGGINTFSTQTFSITVTPINHEPSFVKGANQTILEDAGAQTVNGWATSISAGGADVGQVLTFTVSNDNNGLFSVQPAINSSTGTLTYTPVANANGVANVSIVLTDNGGTSNGGDDTFATQILIVTVTSVNDAPSFVKGSNLSILEDAGAQSVTNWATSISKGPSNESAQVLTFTLSNDNNALFSVQPSINSTTGTLTYTPAANTSGVANINVILTDNGGTANGGDNAFATQTFTISVTAVNNEPSFVKGADQTGLEDAGAKSVTGWATAISAGGGDVGQVLTFTVSNDNNALFSVQPAISSTGVLTYTSAVNVYGASTVSVVLSDNGGTANGGDDTFATQTFIITVSPVNDEPSFTKGLNQIVLEDAGAQTVTNWATSISAGPPNEITQTLSFAVTNNNNGLFAVQPTINSTTGTLTYTPAANANGITTVSVILSDNGGTASGGDNTFATQTFTISVTAVNDSPVISSQTPNPISVTEDVPFNLLVSNLTITDIDNSVFTLSVLAGTNYTFSGNQVTPSLNYNGPLTVNVKVNDGINDSPTFPVSVQVGAINDTPVITGQVSLTTGDGQPLTLKYSDLIVFDPDNTYPTGFALSIISGSNYSVSGFVITPTIGFSGNLTVSIFISDGTNNSAIYPLSIAVNYTNKPPVITGQNPNPIPATEDTALALAVSSLVIADPDNTTFTLTVLSGTNYTFSGNTITPALNFNGALTVNVKVNDGTVDSAPFGVAVQVAPVNDAPTIASQTPNPIGATEDTPFIPQVSNLSVTDVDNTVFTLTVLAGTNYTFSGNTVTPTSNYSGPLTVNVRVSDGAANSATFGMAFQVAPVNDAPIITAQTPNPIVGTQNTPFTLLVSNLTVNDPDNTVFTATVLAGTNYTFSGNTVTPALNYNGTLSVNVKVNDGSADSPAFGVTVTLSAVNVAPVITGQTPNPIGATEDTPFSILVSNLLVTDPDGGTKTITILSGTNYTFSGTTVTPVLNYNGALTVNVMVNDGLANSPAFGVAVQVAPVNDPPFISAQATLTTNEDQPFTILLSHLTVADPDNTYPTGFTLSVQAGTGYTVSGNTITPALNTSGNLNVNVTVSDGTNTSNVFPLLVKVNTVNDAPITTGFLPVNLIEDNLAEQIVSLPPSFTDAEETSSALTYQITANDNPTFFQSIAINQALGQLRFTLNANAFGVAKVTVRASDSGGLSVQSILTINISGINDAPSFDVIANQQIIENSAQQTITITGISRGPFESAQELTWVPPSSNNGVLIPNPTITYDGVSSTALLTYTPAANQSGKAIITVNLIDNGSTAAPNQNTFSRTFEIDVVEVNNPPTITSVSYGPILEDAPQQDIPLTGITAGAGETQTLAVTASTNRPDIVEVTLDYTPSQSTGMLHIKPVANAFGSAQITIRVQDSGSNFPSPNVNFVTNTFVLIVQPVNDLPVIITTPVLTANIGEVYTYNIEATDVEGETLTISAPVKPTWASLSPVSNGKAVLTGTPPAGSGGPVNVIIQVTDAGGVVVPQPYPLTVNSRPTIVPFGATTSEDVAVTIDASKFIAAFSDVDGNGLSEVQIKTLPKHGKLTVSGAAVLVDDKISFANLSSGLIYTPSLNYNGKDTVNWNASDGKSYASTPSYINLIINPVNDPPVISSFESDTLQYKSGSGAVQLTKLFLVTDVDSDSLVSAEIAFRRPNFQAKDDLLVFTNTLNLEGEFDVDAGILTITGKAPLSEYDSAIRGITYEHANAVDPVQETKRISITLGDGKSLSVSKDRLVIILFEKISLDIPGGFTPADDSSPNNTWNILFQNEVPSKNPELKDAILKIYNKRGSVVFETIGFEKEWDGRFAGELVPSDTYFFTIDLKTSSQQTFKGTVTVLR